MPKELLREDVTVLGVPLGEMCNERFHGDRERILMKNIAYAGALAALLEIDMDVVQALLDEKFARKKSAARVEPQGAPPGLRLRQGALRVSAAVPPGTDGRHRRHVLIDGNTAAALGCVYAGATVGAWYPITPATSVMEAFKGFCERYRKDPETGKNNFCIMQAEDELAAIGMVIGACWNGARAFTPTAGPGISLMSEFIGLAYYAEIPAVFFDVQRTGPSTGMPTRTQQADLLSIAYPSHGDTSTSCSSRRSPRSASTSPARRSTWPSASRRRCSWCPIWTSA